MEAGQLEEAYDVVVVGGGAAGVGVSVALRDAGIENFVVLERYVIGASFALWPEETRFITPSFPTNSIGMLDLNSIAVGSSPAHVLGVEHPTGAMYEIYLNAVAKHYELPICQQTEVTDVAERAHYFRVKTSQGVVLTRNIIWAAGEFQFPQIHGFTGSELCRHTATIPSFGALDGDDFVIIGGYESGVDAAYHIAQQDKRVRLLDSKCPWKETSSDPSVALSTYSRERMYNTRFRKHVELCANTEVDTIRRDGDTYEVIACNGTTYRTDVQPILAGGFVGGLGRVAHMFEQRDDGFPELSEHDESTITPGLFLCGPAVRHDNHVFCFIYKYRQRFAVVAKKIATSLGLAAEELEGYRDWGMYLDDLSCCGEECVC